MLLSCECDRHYAPDDAAVAVADADGEALAFHRSLPGYAPTPLHVLPHLAKCLRLDEHSRVLLISTEGDIAPDRCEEIVWLGRNG